ncbi:hypothetical protein MMC09_003650 [Bachmanniomyces sp. S44760]|nr:hypothetical protein [Bachmanniomyces sp. S44760]
MSNDDEGWKPNGRPQSTIAQSFLAALNDAFMIDDHLDGLAKSVEQKKKAVTTQNAELEALEARLRKTEERLKAQQSRSSSPAGGRSGYNSPNRPSVGRLPSTQGTQAGTSSPLASSTQRPAPVVANSFRPHIPGALPESPTESPNNDYVMVDHGQEGSNASRDGHNQRFYSRS